MPYNPHIESDLVKYLSTEHRHADISAETLEVMGKKAANAFIEEDISLNEAVSKLASVHHDINAEQVKRVCEYANTNVYLALHDKNKTAGANSSYPQFELADPSRVIQDLSDGARPTVITHTDAEYGRLPARKEKYSSAYFDAAMSESFGSDRGLDFSRETAIAEIMDAKSSLVDLKSHLERKGEEFTNLQKQAGEEYYELARRHISGGGKMADLVVAARSVADDEKIASPIREVVTRLMKDKVASASELRDGMLAMEKVAHRVVNKEHPLVTSFAAVLAFDNEIEKIASSLEDIEDQLSEVNGFIRSNLMG